MNTSTLRTEEDMTYFERQEINEWEEYEKQSLDPQYKGMEEEFKAKVQEAENKQEEFPAAYFMDMERYLIDRKGFKEFLQPSWLIWMHAVFDNTFPSRADADLAQYIRWNAKCGASTAWSFDQWCEERL
jgi:hypothetical protein